VRWALPAGVTHEQETLPAPCTHLVRQADGVRVHGPGTRRFKATLTGEGWVTGVRFRPAGFFPFARRPMRELVDGVFGPGDVLSASPPETSFDDAPERLLAFLREQAPKDDANIGLVNELVAVTQREGSVLRVEGLAGLAGVSVRTLHRLFERYVGVSSKWIVRRARVQDAAERVSRGERVDWATVARELGYADQAHLIRDFRLQVGVTPAAYAARCAQADPPSDQGM
jgi:AraC-like DNA-binding protein